MNHKLKVGNLYRTDMCTLWSGPCYREGDTGFNSDIVGQVKHGDTVLLLEKLDNEYKVLSCDGQVGWILGRPDGRSRLHSL